MQFAILGPLRLGDGDTGHAVTAGRDRVVLSMLLLHPGRIVGVDELVDAVWEVAPPATARGQLQTCVSRLRRALPLDTIVTDPAGYGVQVGADDLDATVFARLTAQARAHTADTPDEARRLFRTALDLWRGPALVGIDSRAVRHRAAALDELQAVATEDWVDLELSGGRERDLIGELNSLVERFPLRERLRAQLMLTLYRVGRQADALTEYRRARDALRDELGLEPGPALQELHQQILTGDVEPAPATAAVPSALAPVRCLPRTVGDFTGRDAAVDRLIRAIEDGDPGAPAIHPIDGMPGSGKTTLALHVACLLGDRYPDAQLFVDLHGHSDRRPVEPAAALITLLRQLGVAAELIPADLDDRVALWRTELAARRALVVLDNAASTAQVTPLLPAAPGTLALVTSRRRLTGLDGVRPESIQVLTEQEAIRLLARIVGDRVTAEPAAAAEVVRRCGRLPLAIRLAGARLAHRPRWRVADLVRRLGEHGAALPELAAEDRTVASAFALSYGQLDTSAQHVFRLLGLHPGERFDALAVAALTDLPLDDAEDLLDDLVDVHLVEEPAPGSYRLHDLVREYAATLAASAPAESNRAAVVNLLDFQLHAFAIAGSGTDQRQTAVDLGLAAPRRPDLAAALRDHAAHLERERSNLAALVDAGVAIGQPQWAWLLPRAAWRYLWQRGYTDDITVSHSRGLQRAREQGDDTAVAMMANYLASAYSRVARYDLACHLVEESIALRRRHGDHRGEAVSIGNLSVLYEAMGRLEESAELSLRAIKLRLRLGDSDGLALRLNSLGVVYNLLGRYDDALRNQRRRLLIATEENDLVGIANSFLHIAISKRRLGRADLAHVHHMLRVTLRLQREAGYSIGEAETLSELAGLHREDGRFAEAVEGHRAAIEIAVRIGDRRYEAVFLNDLAFTVVETGDAAGACDLHRRALTIATEIKHPYEQGRACTGLGGCSVDADPERARQLWEEALAIFTRMGVPDRHDVQRRLDALRHHRAAPAQVV
jgi:DNA-binding SARP family transcriptional activator/tetratricopeptide (TPR) repeat protein